VVFGDLHVGSPSNARPSGAEADPGDVEPAVAPSRKRGRFVTFEGGEGVGKSTQIGRLAERLKGRGVSVVTTREPGGSPRAEALRNTVLAGSAKAYGSFAEALIFSAARLSHLELTIRPALAQGDWVLSDRFSDSTRAYQGALGQLDPGLIGALERVVVQDDHPDLTVLLDAPASVGLSRAAARRHGTAERADRFEAETEAFHERLRQAFLAIAASEPHRWVVVRADRDPDEVERDVWAAVEARLNQGVQPAGTLA
jgi:dTMP kinase